MVWWSGVRRRSSDLLGGDYILKGGGRAESFHCVLLPRLFVNRSRETEGCLLRPIRISYVVLFFKVNKLSLSSPPYYRDGY